MAENDRKPSGLLSKAGIGCLVIIAVLLVGMVAAYFVLSSIYPYPDDGFPIREKINFYVASTTIVKRAALSFSQEKKEEKKKALQDLLHQIFQAKINGKITYQDLKRLQIKFRKYNEDENIQPEEFEIIEQDARDLLHKAGIAVPDILEEEITRLRKNITDKGDPENESRNRMEIR